MELTNLNEIRDLIAIGVKNVLNTKEAALLLGISESRLAHLTSDGAVPHFKGANGRNYFRKSDLEDWLLGEYHPSNEQVARNPKKFLSR